eukprot:scaffold9821_cov140-Isochrysis_galbana.AAC.5
MSRVVDAGTHICGAQSGRGLHQMWAHMWIHIWDLAKTLLRPLHSRARRDLMLAGAGSKGKLAPNSWPQPLF